MLIPRDILLRTQTYSQPCKNVSSNSIRREMLISRDILILFIQNSGSKTLCKDENVKISQNPNPPIVNWYFQPCKNVSFIKNLSIYISTVLKILTRELTPFILLLNCVSNNTMSCSLCNMTLYFEHGLEYGFEYCFDFLYCHFMFCAEMEICKWWI